MKKRRVAINGFGRIGRAAFKIIFERKDMEIVAINDITDVKVNAHMLKYDSVYGIYEHEISVEEGGTIVTNEGGETQKEHLTGSQGEPDFLIVNKKRICNLAIKDPVELPWDELEVDVVLECTGLFVKDGAAKAHLKAGAKRVIVSAPTKGIGDIKTFLRGVNESEYSNQDIISNASCTTNCVAVVAAVINKAFGVKKAAMTTVHAITAETNLVDGPPPRLHPDLRRSRSSMVNMLPTTTGAAISTTKVIPELEGLFDGLAVRVPVLIGSLSDVTFLVKKNVTVNEVNDVFIQAKDTPQYKNVLDVVYEPIVSSDIIKTPYSAIVDLSLTKVIDGDLVKVVAWYDNEWGYANRLVEMADKVKV